MYFADHGDPHFHIITRDDERVAVRISDGVPMAGSAKAKDICDALVWAKENRSELMALWARFSEEE